MKRLKRDYISLVDLESEKPLTREKRLQLNAYGAASNAVNSIEENYATAHKTKMFNDELWNQEWYLVMIFCNYTAQFCFSLVNNILLPNYKY